ncbi:RNA polymerase sigma factor [Algihabitans albus]|uniref:RNA polymerase sigma factor n=1 Tax=Algihabitans albus TaxID=2164067 RepID=UPI0013C2D3DD|nr:RNA polymerase sigma factor [Algihabitans albus]
MGSRDWSRARDGEEPAWLNVFLANQNKLLAFFGRKAGARDQPRDLLHDLFVRMAQNAGAAGIDDPRAYIFRAAANVAIDAARADRYRRAEAPPPPVEELHSRDPSPDALQTTIDRDHLRRLDEALAKLPEQTRAMIYLLRIEGQNYEGVAALFGLSKSAVEKRVAKALQRCKIELEAGGRGGR